jgi:hypothetical protein
MIVKDEEIRLDMPRKLNRSFPSCKREDFIRKLKFQ